MVSFLVPVVTANSLDSLCLPERLEVGIFALWARAAALLLRSGRSSGGAGTVSRSVSRWLRLRTQLVPLRVWLPFFCFLLSVSSANQRTAAAKCVK